MMSEWGIPFDYIEDHWDDAQFALMGKMLAERLDKRGRTTGGHKPSMKVKQFLQMQGLMPNGN